MRLILIKEGLKEAKERMNAWWEHEIIDRPVFAYNYSKTSGIPAGLMFGWEWIRV